LKENLDMKLQTGKFYRTKAGRRVGPMLYESDTWHQDGIPDCASIRMEQI
jgi:hypothetical protein